MTSEVMKVFIFKSSNEEGVAPDKFESALKSANFYPVIIPVLSFDFCNLETLWHQLQTPERFNGIIFTSPRCVLSFKKITQEYDNAINKWGSNLQMEWSHKWIFCVGPSTFEAASNIFDNTSKIITSDDGNAESLGNKIVETLKSSTNSDLPLLFPCGNLQKDTLKNILSSNNLKTESVVVYETVQNPNLPSLIAHKDLDEGGFDPYVFFSPSGIHISLPYLTDIVKTNRPLIALGPTTYDALLSIVGVDSKNIFQCKHPTPESLLEILKEIYEPRKCTEPIEIEQLEVKSR